MSSENLATGPQTSAIDSAIFRGIAKVLRHMIGSRTFDVRLATLNSCSHESLQEYFNALTLVMHEAARRSWQKPAQCSRTATVRGA